MAPAEPPPLPGDEALLAAAALFEAGDMAGADDKVQDAVEDIRNASLEDESPSHMSGEDDVGHVRTGRSGSNSQGYDESSEWREALDTLAGVYEEAGDAERAEALYLRMLAWREGAEQFRAGHFSSATHLFQKSPEYKGVDDATWFLKTLRPHDGHAVSDVVGLLALGEQVAAKAAVALWTLALQPKQRASITECGGLELIVKAMAYHIDCAEIQAAGAGALKLLCRKNPHAKENRQALSGRLGLVDVLAVSMRQHLEDPEVQREACGVLQAVCIDNVAGAYQIGINEGIILCLEAMANCPDSAVGEAGNRALEAMCSNEVLTAGRKDDDEEDDGNPSISEEEAAALKSERERGFLFCMDCVQRALDLNDVVSLQSLLGAAAIFTEDPTLRSQGLRLLRLVGESMQRHAGTLRVQVPACALMWRLTVGHPKRDEAVAIVARGGGCASICQAMRDDPTHLKLQRAGIGALRNISLGSDANKTLTVRSGGIQLIVLAMQRFPKDIALQEQAIGCLTSLCDTVGRAVICARARGLEAIVSAIKNHLQEEHLTELACVTLCMFCDDANLRQSVLTCGALSVAKTLSKVGVGEAQRWGCELLRDLTDPH